MDSMLEKFTLYDLFSYFIPGFLCLCFIGISFLPEIIVNYDPNIYSGLNGFFLLVFLILSYVTGIALSSVAAFLFNRIPFKEIEIGKSDETILIRALVNSGLQQDEINNKKNEAGKKALSFVFAQYIYSDIQADSNFRRIHNYASSETLYKNLACAFLMSAFVTFLLSCFENWKMLYGMKYIYIIEILFTIVFLFRWRRFKKKKMSYAINWFIGKYAKKNRG